MLGAVLHICNPNPGEAGARGFHISDQTGLHGLTLSQKKNTTTATPFIQVINNIFVHKVTDKKANSLQKCVCNKNNIAK